MIEVENMSVKDMLGIINVPSIECVMMTDDAKKEILTRFAEKDKVIELMVIDFRKAITCGNRQFQMSGSIEQVIQHFTKQVKLQADKEEADE